MPPYPPTPDPQAIIQFLASHYELDVTCVTQLAGEADLNYKIQTPSENYLLKIAPPGTLLDQLQLQVAIMEHLGSKPLPFSVSSIVKSSNGESLTQLVFGQQTYYCRLQNWVVGQPIGYATLRNSHLLRQWGQTTAAINRALADFDHPAAHRFYAWNPSECLAAKPTAQYFKNQEQRKLADYFWDYFADQIRPKLPTLRKGTNYNDAHELNLLLDPESYAPHICGLIDFGDALYCETINELAIACAYAGMEVADPLSAFVAVTEGFHAEYSLEAEEIEVLFGLIAARLLISLATSAVNKKLQPDNEYLSISEKPAWELLEKMRHISPGLAHYRLRRACGWEAVPRHSAFQAWAANPGEKFHPVMDLSQASISQLDCSVSSLSLGNNENYGNDINFTATINRMIAEGGGTVGVGGYGEVRPFYTTDAFQSEGNDGPRWRSVHLGYDIWAAADSPVFAPLNGRVHSFHYDPAPGSYGATILLEHQTSKLTFYTLYGHLSKASLQGLSEGQPISAGQQIATLGTREENGGWPPHLHFQVMLDTLGWRGDFPGVAYPTEAATWMSICPDPRSLMPPEMQNQLGYVVPAIDVVQRINETQRNILEDRKKQLGRSLSISYQQPLHVVRGFMSHLYTSDGRRYLDTVNNVAHVGHEHPAVVRAGQRQMAVLNTNTRYLHEEITAYAKELLATFPPELSVVHFVNSGSEANELALRMARAHTGSRNVVAMQMGYHGNTGGTVDVSSYKFDRQGGYGAPSTTRLVPIPDVYRGEFTDPVIAGTQYAAYVDRAIEQFQQGGEKVGAFLCESILSCGGQIELPAGFLRQAYASIRAAGGLCIADEVQVGLGRVGSHWWGFELQGVVPDIVTLGKPLGNGHPLGAVICTTEVARSFANGMEYFNTFGGNPVSCAIGRAVLHAVKKEGLKENAQKMEALLRAGLKDLQQQYPVIGHVRGKGLFLGVELVKDPITKAPATKLASFLKNEVRRLGVLMSTDGPDENVLKIKPPLCFDEKNAGQLLDTIQTVLGAI